MTLEGFPYDFGNVCWIYFYAGHRDGAAPGVNLEVRLWLLLVSLQFYVGIAQEMIGLMIALYIAMDSFGTAL